MHRKISHERPPRVKTPKAIPASEHVRVAHQGTPDRHPLALAAGELAGPAVEIGAELYLGGRGVDLARGLVARHAAEARFL